jgi:NADPH-dependent curcumin reductase CurA
VPDRSSREVRLVRRPRAAPQIGDFALAAAPVPPAGEGQVLVRNVFLSVDPFMRGLMRDDEDYLLPPYRVGEALYGGAVGEVVESRAPGFTRGDCVTHMAGFREWSLCGAAELERVDPRRPLSLYLGALGMTGLTAWAGMLDVARIRPGETVFVSGAAGAVGSVAGQIARIGGCRVIGSAGSSEKAKWVTEVLRFDHCFDYRRQDPGEALTACCPGGIDVYFDNVGGRQLEAAIEHMRPLGRIALCGMISQYNDASAPPGPHNLFQLITRQITVSGFTVNNFAPRMARFREDVAGWITAGLLHAEETVVEGIESAADALIGVLAGRNRGKMLVRAGADPVASS